MRRDLQWRVRILERVGRCCSEKPQQHGRSTRYSPLIRTRRLRVIDGHQRVGNSDRWVDALPQSPQDPQCDVRRKASNAVEHQRPKLPFSGMGSSLEAFSCSPTRVALPHWRVHQRHYQRREPLSLPIFELVFQHRLIESVLISIQCRYNVMILD
jgi:hypothetical protein